MVQLGLFYCCLCRNRESNSLWFSCTFSGDLCSGHFTGWAIEAVACSRSLAFGWKYFQTTRMNWCQSCCNVGVGVWLVGWWRHRLWNQLHKHQKKPNFWRFMKKCFATKISESWISFFSRRYFLRFGSGSLRDQTSDRACSGTALSPNDNFNCDWIQLELWMGSICGTAVEQMPREQALERSLVWIRLGAGLFLLLSGPFPLCDKSAVY